MEDDFDVNTWLILIRKRREIYMNKNEGAGKNGDEEIQLGDSSMPSIRPSSLRFTPDTIDLTAPTNEDSVGTSVPPTAIVGTNDQGNVCV